MTNYVYSRYDKLEGLYAPPFIAANDDVACRTFAYLYGVPGKAEKATYHFVRLGVFNNETGALESSDIFLLDTVFDQFIEALNLASTEDVGDGKTLV
uniref:Nonstructural protein n=1 Tax=Dulem virus 80 TaxID=3145791 RepID=A0AAU8AW40_9VIRU